MNTGSKEGGKPRRRVEKEQRRQNDWLTSRRESESKQGRSTGKKSLRHGGARKMRDGSQRRVAM